MLSRSLQALSFVCLVGLLSVGCQQVDEPRPSTAQGEVTDDDALIAPARAAAMELGKALQSVLIPTIQSDGPIAAIAVCNEDAPQIAARITAETGYQVGRTALKLRNPDNTPDAWERAQLLAFQQALSQDSVDPSRMEHAEIFTEGGVETLRYMKPIPMGGVCATCHGEDIDPELEAAIRARYPEDGATGFKQGDLRGAFTITRRLEGGG